MKWTIVKAIQLSVVFLIKDQNENEYILKDYSKHDLYPIRGFDNVKHGFENALKYHMKAEELNVGPKIIEYDMDRMYIIFEKLYEYDWKSYNFDDIINGEIGKMIKKNIRILHKNDICHGDLNHGNIMYRPPNICLFIDFDVAFSISDGVKPHVIRNMIDNTEPSYGKFKNFYMNTSFYFNKYILYEFFYDFKKYFRFLYIKKIK